MRVDGLAVKDIFLGVTNYFGNAILVDVLIRFFRPLPLKLTLGIWKVKIRDSLITRGWFLENNRLKFWKRE